MLEAQMHMLAVGTTIMLRYRSESDWRCGSASARYMTKEATFTVGLI
jgi:hypothetical protein